MKVFFVRHGETLNNRDKQWYVDGTEAITQKGISQAVLAGKYLKSFGKFDLVISSPATRCLQTAEHICKEIEYDKKIKINYLLFETICKKIITIPTEERKQYLDQNFREHPKYGKTHTEWLTTTDPFKRLEMFESNIDIYHNILGDDTLHITINKYKKFLSQIKKLNKKCILVVGHGGTIIHMTTIICNLPIDSYTSYNSNSISSIISKQTRYNCIPSKNDIYDTSIMACRIKK